MFKDIIVNIVNDSLKKEDFLSALRENISNYVLILIFIFAFFAVVTSLSRVPSMGWQPIFGLHVFLFFILLLSVVFRRKLSSNFKAILLVSIFYSAGTAALLQFGVLSSSFMLYTMAAILSLLLLKFRYFLFICFLTTLTVFVLGVYNPDAHITSGIDANVP